MNSASLGQFGTMSLMYMDSPGSKVGKVLAMETVVVRSIPELSKFKGNLVHGYSLIYHTM